MDYEYKIISFLCTLQYIIVFLTQINNVVDICLNLFAQEVL